MSREWMKRISSLAIAALLISALVGCGAKKAFDYGSAETGYMLTYRPQAAPIKYESVQEQVQNIEMMGQNIESTTDSKSKLTIAFKGVKEGNMVLGVTIDDMSMSAASMQGDMTADMSGVIGKSFEFQLSPLGKESNFVGANELKFSVGPMGERSVEPGFRSIFPDLNDKPLKIGDSWESEDITDMNESGMDIKLVFNNVNTIAGIEVVDGIECIKIEVESEGTMDGTGEQMGADLAIEGDIEGTSAWYFAYKGGYLVKQEVESFTEATVAVSGPQNITLPMTMDSKTTLMLKK